MYFPRTALTRTWHLTWVKYCAGYLSHTPLARNHGYIYLQTASSFKNDLAKQQQTNKQAPTTTQTTNSLVCVCVLCYQEARLREREERARKRVRVRDKRAVFCSFFPFLPLSPACLFSLFVSAHGTGWLNRRELATSADADATYTITTVVACSGTNWCQCSGLRYAIRSCSQNKAQRAQQQQQHHHQQQQRVISGVCC